MGDTHRVRKIDPSGTILPMAGTGTDGDAGEDGPAVQARIRDPWQLAVAPDGSLLLVDWSEQALTVIKRRDHLILLGLAKRKKKAKGEEPTG